VRLGQRPNRKYHQQPRGPIYRANASSGRANSDARKQPLEQERVRKEEREWQRKWFKPPVPNPTFKVQPDDGLLMRAGKRVANKYIYDIQINLHRWRDESEARRQAK
jgi:hypothetical protein